MASTEEGRLELSPGGQWRDPDVHSKRISRVLAWGITIAAAFAFGGAPAWAQSFPTKPITIAVAAGPGTSPDLVSRVITSAMTERLGWTFVVENRTGGNFLPGIRHVLRQPADGYTILPSFSSMTVMPHSMPDLGFDVVKDFVPLGRVSASPTVLFASPTAPFRTARELVEYAKRHPDELAYGTAGHATYHHLAGELFKQLNGIAMRNVPYKDANFSADVISGTVPVGINVLAAIRGLLDAGRLRGLAILSPRRSAAAPDLPTLAEAGLPSMDLDVWIGWVVRAGTPQPIVETLRRELAVTLRSPAVKTALEKVGSTPAVNESPEDLQRLVQTQIETWGRVIREANIKFQ